MQQTQRTFTDAETGYNCRLYTSHDASKSHLIFENNTPEAPADGSEVNGFYISAHTSATIRLNTKKEVFVNSGQFYHLKEGEKATHRKFCGFNRFTKIN